MMKLRVIHRLDSSDVSWVQRWRATDNARPGHDLRFLVWLIRVLVSAKYFSFLQYLQLVWNPKQIDTLLDLKTGSPSKISQTAALDDLE